MDHKQKYRDYIYCFFKKGLDVIQDNFNVRTGLVINNARLN